MELYVQCNQVCLEVVRKISGSNDQGQNKLLQWQVPCLAVYKYFANEVDLVMLSIYLALQHWDNDIFRNGKVNIK